MKIKALLILIFSIAYSPSGFGQKDSSGLYFNAKDFQEGKLHFAINCKMGKHKIKTDMIFKPNSISIKHGDSTYTYPKDFIYGIKYCDGTTTRIFEHKEYPLINPGEKIMIYKIISGTGLKGNPISSVYYFSQDVNGAIKELTVGNLKSSFPANHKFHDLIDMTFRNDEELFAYDSFHKIMKINHVFEESLKEK